MYGSSTSIPPSRGLDSGTGVVRLERVLDRDWESWLSRLEMLLLERLEDGEDLPGALS